MLFNDWVCQPKLHPRACSVIDRLCPFFFGDAGRRFNGRVRVQFLDDGGRPEEGVDLGGPYKEFLEQLCTKLFKNDYGLFALTAETRLFYPNPAGAALIPGTLFWGGGGKGRCRSRKGWGGIET